MAQGRGFKSLQSPGLSRTRHLGEVSCRLGDGPQAEKGPASRGARVPRKCKCRDWCEPGQWQSPAALALLSKRPQAPPVEWNVAGAGGATEPFDLPVPPALPAQRARPAGRGCCTCALRQGQVPASRHCLCSGARKGCTEGDAASGP